MTTTPRTRTRKSPLRAALYAASAAIIALALVTVPLPVIEYVPGTPTEIAPLVELDGTETDDLDGRAALLTVLLRQQPTLPAIGAWLDPQRSLLPVDAVYPAETDRESFLTTQRDRFGRQFDIAAGVGAEAAGVDTELITEAVVVDVVPESPAEGTLRPGDAVLAVDDDPIVAAEELQDIARDGEVGQTLQLTIRREGREREVAVELGELPEAPYPIIGITIETALDELELPFEVELADGTSIGGPSAGMMIALTVFDLLDDDDLLDGRTVVGTGTVDADGRVGPVGGVAEKMRSTGAYGADVVLVPADQVEEARATLPDGIELIGVETFTDALEALREG